MERIQLGRLVAGAPWLLLVMLPGPRTHIPPHHCAAEMMLPAWMESADAYLFKADSRTSCACEYTKQWVNIFCLLRTVSELTSAQPPEKFLHQSLELLVFELSFS